MTLQARRGIILAGILIIAGILAFPLRDMIYEVVVIPIAYIGWRLNLAYRSFPQGGWWWIIVFVVLLMVMFSLMPRPAVRKRMEAKSKPPVGQVEALSVWLQRTDRGVYFKWLVANRLGKLAYQILLHRESGRPRSVFAPLVGSDWEPAKELQSYLEVGLHGSFADFPDEGRRFGAPQRTPLDLEISEAVEFLESQVENNHSPQGHKNIEA